MDINSELINLLTYKSANFIVRVEHKTVNIYKKLLKRNDFIDLELFINVSILKIYNPTKHYFCVVNRILSEFPLTT